jgi:hypothetical protein
LPFDWEIFAQSTIKTRTDLGTFLVSAGVGGLAEAITNFAPHADTYTIALLVGAIVLGAKKLLIDRDKIPHPKTAAKPPRKKVE